MRCGESCRYLTYARACATCSRHHLAFFAVRQIAPVFRGRNTHQRVKRGVEVTHRFEADAECHLRDAVVGHAKKRGSLGNPVSAQILDATHAERGPEHRLQTAEAEADNPGQIPDIDGLREILVQVLQSLLDLGPVYIVSVEDYFPR